MLVLTTFLRGSKMTQVMSERIQYSPIEAPIEISLWKDHYVVTKNEISGPWGSIPKGTVMQIKSTSPVNVFKTFPSKTLDFSFEVSIAVHHDELLREYIHFIEPKQFY